MRSVATSAAAHAAKNGNSKIEALFNTLLAWLHIESGAFESAEDLCRRAFELAGNPGRGVGVLMGHVMMAMAALGRSDADAALTHIGNVFEINPPATHFWRILSEICAVEAHLMKANLPDAGRSARRVLRFSANLPEKTWKAIAFSVCAKVSERNDQHERAREYVKSGLKLIDSAELPLAKWRVEAAAAEVLRSESEAEGRHLKDRSETSRRRLFDSLGEQDSLRRFLHAKAPE